MRPGLAPELGIMGITMAGMIGEERSRVRLPIERGALLGFPAGLVPATVDGLNGPGLPSFIARFAAK